MTKPSRTNPRVAQSGPLLHVVEYRCLSDRGRWLAWAPIAGRGYYNRRDALRARDRLAAKVGVSEYRVAVYTRER